MTRSNLLPPHNGTRAATRFVILMGVVSLFADATYEGARSILGPYLLALGASATGVGFVSGFGELVGYGLRLVSGRLADRTRRFWDFTVGGYALNLLSVPLLALVGRWEVAALLVVVERAGKAIRTPPRDAMLSYAASRVGPGWAFGLHEALDQIGAVAGPLIAAAVLAAGGGLRGGFAALAVPAVLSLLSLARARVQFPQPSRMEDASFPLDLRPRRALGLYLLAAGLVAAGFADFPLLAYHFTRTAVVPQAAVPVLYAFAMATDAVAALVVGRWFDRYGTPVLALGTAETAAFAPLAIFGGPTGAVVGAVLWGMGVGLQESVLRAAVVGMVPPDRRGSAFGLFQTVYGVAWFAGSALMGVLYDARPAYLAWFAAITQTPAAALFAAVAAHRR
ncbi:MAG: MFS transporter [Armatimonadota bacterium]|nr:MFS transporter [Armatimonadota bacterium]